MRRAWGQVVLATHALRIRAQGVPANCNQRNTSPTTAPIAATTSSHGTDTEYRLRGRRGWRRPHTHHDTASPSCGLIAQSSDSRIRLKQSQASGFQEALPGVWRFIMEASFLKEGTG